MNGVHDMGGMHGMGPVEAERDEPRVPHRVGAARLRDHPRQRLPRQVEHRHVALRARADAAGRVPGHARTTSTGSGGSRSCSSTAASSRGRRSRARLADGRPRRRLRRRACACSRRRTFAAALEQLRRASRMDAAVAPRFTVGDHVVTKNMQPARPYAAAALRARPARRGRPRSRRLRVPRRARGRAGKAAAALLQRAVRGPRAVGPEAPSGTPSTSICSSDYLEPA